MQTTGTRLTETLVVQDDLKPLIPHHFAKGSWLPTSDWRPVPPDKSHPAGSSLPSSLRLLSWNVDFMAPNQSDRLRCALSHIRSHLSSASTSTSGRTSDTSEAQSVTAEGTEPVPCCILLQEISGGAFPALLSDKWVRRYFTVVPNSVTEWPTRTYGVATLISRSIPVLKAQSLAFSNSRMGRNALLVDVRLSVSPSSLGNSPDGETNERSRTHVLRIGNVHLESLPQGTPMRPSQLMATGKMLRAEDVNGGIVGGDMNPIDPIDAAIHQNAGLEDAYRGAEENENSFTWGYQPPSGYPARRMDKIFYTAQEGCRMQVDEPERIGVGLRTAQGQWVSDHYGLLTTVQLDLVASVEEVDAQIPSE
ncbi:uncharacterized protein FIBRA_06137 [Fibroporia radiculosa]|uniref:Endonuclease/exonuclease/phosphatase domain-containing protein n=1 Tax=Fibroporia radiculosa TaxID=599839 RepID=J4IB37_9APHY|nr:uncharacterized protein FIBRA_06137 [Fibroporia radiculosa]CCM03981.1 predicted protein [Fibroporia radiculosa]